MEKNNEIWRDIKGYPNYQVSNLGRIKSLNYHRTGKEKILKSAKNSKGYLLIVLYKDGKGKTNRIHRIVASAFLPNPDNLPQVNHKDEDKTNNTIWINDDGSVDLNKSNLEWCDCKYNINYGSRTKKTQKLILQFSKTGEFIKMWKSCAEIERELGLDHSSIQKCCIGKMKTAGNYKWGYEKDYERIPFKVFDIEIYRKRVA